MMVVIFISVVIFTNLLITMIFIMLSLHMEVSWSGGTPVIIHVLKHIVGFPMK